MKTSEQMAESWNVKKNIVNIWCRLGKIPGAVKDGRSWMIPDTAEKPIDNRLSSGRYVKNKEEKRKSLPIGISDYRRAQAEYYYVDKTLLIKDFLDKKPLVSLFTRPRRFGKTLNMDMLRVFFEKTYEDTSIFFRDKDIWKCGKEYQEYQGKYPVIFLSFKDVKCNTWEDTINHIETLLQDECERHAELLVSDKLSKYEKAYIEKVLEGNANTTELCLALKKLSEMLTKHYGEKTVIIIDEYDTPIQEGYTKDFYDEIVSFMRNFFSGAFKDNQNLAFGFLTGILRISQESLFSGLNNLTVNSVMDDEYDRYFGFTEKEIKNMLKYYNASDKEIELKEWYDGYRFGSTEIYNPWSVINYVSRDFTPQAYWVNTGKNEILGDVLTNATEDIVKKLYALLAGDSITARIDQNVIYRSLSGEPENVYSLLLVAGYLKVLDKSIQSDGSYLCDIAIPNKEISAVYKKEILAHLIRIGAVERSAAIKVAESLYCGDTKGLQNVITEYMEKTISFYDAGTEGFYHGLMLGLITMMGEHYRIKSNRESGNGRYDIGLIPMEIKYPGIIIELKWEKGLDITKLEVLAEKALSQIDEKRYNAELNEIGVEKVLWFGIAFSGKKAVVKSI